MDAYIRRGGPNLVERGRCTKPAPWQGLEPVRDLGDGVSLGDEAVRERLVRVRIHKADWEQLAPLIQGRLKAAVRALFVLEAAVMSSALPGADGPRRRAQAYLKDFVSWYAAQTRRRSSFAWPHPRSEPGSHLKAKHDRLVPLLKEIKQEAAERRRGFRDEAWKRRKADVVNQQMAGGLEPDHPACDTRHIEALETSRPTVVAARLLASAYTGATGDQLRRRKPRKA